MAVETGVAEFGSESYGVMTKDDVTRLVRLAVLGAFAVPSEGYQLRMLIRRMAGFLGGADLVMLAELMKTADGVQKVEWVALAAELMTRTGL